MSNNYIKANSGIWTSVIKGVIISISITLISILAFAFLIRFLNISDKLIFPINQAIKIFSLFIGILIAIKSIKEKGFLKGLIIGLLYFVINLILFSILQGKFSFNLSNLIDMVLTILMGGFIGIIIVNIAK